MDIFGGIEKLIIEHGSAAILKERLLLVADQYAALEKALADSEAKAKEATAQKEHFELENAKLKEEMRRLQEPYKSPGRHPSDRVLSFVCHYPNASEADIAAGVDIPPASVRHWLEHFRQHGKMLDEFGNVTDEAIHYLSNKGLL